MLDFIILKNGNLRLEFVGDKCDKEDLKVENEIGGSDHALRFASERQLCNGWGLHDADELGQLSTAPVIAEDSIIEDDGTVTLNGRAWYHPEYMITNPIQQILDNGEVDFQFWMEFDNRNFPHSNI